MSCCEKCDGKETVREWMDKHGLEIGDKVRVVKLPYEYSDETHIGKEYSIIGISKDQTHLKLDYSRAGYTWDWYLLDSVVPVEKPVENRIAQILELLQPGESFEAYNGREVTRECDGVLDISYVTVEANEDGWNRPVKRWRGFEAGDSVLLERVDYE